MTSVTTQDRTKSLRSGGSGHQDQSLEDSIDSLLGILISADRPLTLRQIAIMADMPPADAACTLQGLCQAGVLRRLNTVIETYTARFL
jgi:hypothetical protein